MNRRSLIALVILLLVCAAALAYWVAGRHRGPVAILQVGESIPAQQLDAALQSQDINAIPAGRTTVIDPGRAYDITGGGADIGGSAADGFRFSWMQVKGNFDARTQVSSLSQIVPGTRAGLMVRDSLDPSGRMVFAGATASDGHRFNYRASAGAQGVYTKSSTASYPNVWMRLTREGDVFTGYGSADGVNWIETGRLTLSLPTTLYLGMAVCSHVPAQTSTAQFRNFSVAGKLAESSQHKQ